MEAMLGELRYGRPMFYVAISRMAIVFEAPLLGGVSYRWPQFVASKYTTTEGRTCGPLGILAHKTPAMWRAERDTFIAKCEAEGDTEIRKRSESRPRWSLFELCDECDKYRLSWFFTWR